MEKNIKIANDYKSGGTLMSLSIKYGMSIVDIRKIIVGQDVAIRKKGSMTTITPDETIKRNQNIKKLYLEKGMTYQAIGDIYGITREGIRQILLKMKVDTQTKRKIVPTDFQKTVAAQYDSGEMTPRQIMDKHEITYSKLRQCLNAAGVPIKPKGFFLRRKNYVSICNGVIQDYINGIKPVEISKKYDLCSETEIYKILKKTSEENIKACPNPNDSRLKQAINISKLLNYTA